MYLEWPGSRIQLNVVLREPGDFFLGGGGGPFLKVKGAADD